MNLTVQNPQTSFKAIYIPQNAIFNRAQEPVVADIRAKLTTQLPQFNNKSADKFYEQNHDIAFEIKPSHDNFESVNLFAHKGAKKIGDGIINGITYSDSVLVGQYNEDKPFDLSDIDKEINRKKKIKTAWHAVIAVSAIAAIASIIQMMFFDKPHNTKTEETIKPLIEQVDTVAKKAATHLKW